MANQDTPTGGKNGDIPQAEVMVVMVPLPLQGHLNQLLQLSRLIASYNIPVHYVGSAIHTRQAKLRVHGWEPLAASNMQFCEFPSPPFHNPPPDPNTKFPSHLLPCMRASLYLREPTRKYVQQLSIKSRRVIVIYDSLMAWVVQDVSMIPNAEPYCFQNASAFTILSFKLEVSGKPIPAELEVLKDLPSLEECVTSDFSEFSRIQRESRKYNSGNLFNSCRIVEGQFIGLLAKEHLSGTNKIWAIGPFNPVVMSSEKNSNRRRHECLEWLDKQAPKSVIFVSFGTTTSLSHDQIKELAIGLEKSGQQFIWVLRDADKGDIFEGDVRVALPREYEGRIISEGRGIIERDWAPQLEILGHPSTGGFMSHCGWNSCMESITMGVPIAAWPMHTDQPRNTVLITEVLKIGLVVRDWAHSSELVTSTIIENAIKRLMVSADGEEMRLKAAALSRAIKKSVTDGGLTRKEMDSFIAHITR